MIKIRDRDGSILRGAHKTTNGAIVFTQSSEYTRYIKEKQKVIDRSKELDQLKGQILDLSNMVRTLKERT